MSDLLKVRVGGSSYLCKWEEQKNPIFLTYFDNFDSQTGTDHPKIGNDYILTEYTGSVSSLSSVIRSWNGYNIPFLCQGNSSTLDIAGSFSIDKKVISMENLFFCPEAHNRTSSTEILFEILAGSKTISSSPGLSHRPVMIISAYDSLENNWYVDRSWSSSGSYTGTYTLLQNNGIDVDAYHHRAAVYDFNENKLYAYVDGLLCFVDDFSAYYTDGMSLSIYFNFYFRNNWNMYASQFAVFDFDKSTQNRTTYPVPTKPYWNF
jgi:hypothetical protein